MQTRIKILELENGEKTFYPQYYDEDYFSKLGMDRWKYFMEYIYLFGSSHKQAVARSQLKYAQKYIDEQLGLEIKSTTFVKYP